MAVFASVYETVLQEFGRSDLFEVVSCDAGFCSLENATRIHESGKAYVFGLKGNQPKLYKEAQRILLPMAQGAPKGRDKVGEGARDVCPVPAVAESGDARVARVGPPLARCGL